MFIRIKKRKNKAGKVKSYAYLVESKHYKRKKTPRQKVKAYLGRVYHFERKKALGMLYASKEVTGRSYKTIIKGLIGKELEARGFIKQGNTWENTQVVVDLEARKVFDKTKGNSICLAVNDGFLARYTLKEVLDFKPPEAIEREVGKALGNAIVAAGIPVDHGLFITLFWKIMASSHL